jgi:putative endonuclease
MERPKRNARRGLGARGELIAAEHLRQRGYRLLATNWRTAAGEIDIIAQDGDTLVFVEVRTRRGIGFGSPEESVTAAKQARLIALAEAYRQEHPAAPEAWRIDVVAVGLTPQGRLERVDVLQNAVEA